MRTLTRVLLLIVAISSAMLFESCGNGKVEKKQTDLEKKEYDVKAVAEAVNIAKGKWTGGQGDVKVTVELDPYEESFIDNTGMDERTTNAIITIDGVYSFPFVCVSHGIELNGSNVIANLMDPNGGLVPVICRYLPDGKLVFVRQKLMETQSWPFEKITLSPAN